MPKQIPEEELDAIVAIVTRFPDGVSFGDILKELKIPISLRNLQHRLLHLVKKGCLHAEGKVRGRLYKLPLEANIDQYTSQTEQKEVGIQLSLAAEESLNKINQPLQLRKPVGYNREFLDGYRPNVSNYLSESITQRLY